MLEDLIGFIACIIIPILLGIALFFSTIFLPIIYLEGKAKSEILKSIGIEMPWYKATFVPDTVFVPIPKTININSK